MCHAEHFYFFTETNIRLMLRDCGYEVVEVVPDPLYGRFWVFTKPVRTKPSAVRSISLHSVSEVGDAHECLSLQPRQLEASFD